MGACHRARCGTAALGVLGLDTASVGNLVEPGPGDWRPGIAMAVLLDAVLPGILEQLLFRGMLFRVLRARLSVPVAMAVSSGLFALGHLSDDMHPLQLLTVAVFTFVSGILFAIAYQRTGSLYAPMVAHIAGDLGPALSLALPPEAMVWVHFVITQLAVISMVPLVVLSRRKGTTSRSWVTPSGRG